MKRSAPISKLFSVEHGFMFVIRSHVDDNNYFMGSIRELPDTFDDEELEHDEL